MLGFRFLRYLAGRRTDSQGRRSLRATSQNPELCFHEFDWHVCSLLGTPLPNASLAVKNSEVAVLALGMGAPVSAVQLMELEGPGIDLAAEVETPAGRCTLMIAMAKAGHVDALRYVIERGAKLQAKDNNGHAASPALCSYF